MGSQLQAAVAVATLLTGLVSGSVMIENRYAKAYEVQQQLDGLYAKTLKLRILELELKPADQFSAADKALLEHLKQELREVTTP